MMNKYLEIVSDWLIDAESVSQKELESNFLFASEVAAVTLQETDFIVADAAFACAFPDLFENDCDQVATAMGWIHRYEEIVNVQKTTFSACFYTTHTWRANAFTYFYTLPVGR